MLVRSRRNDAARGPRWHHVAPAAGYVVAVFVLGSLPQQGLPALPAIGVDKLAHAAAFLVMALLFMRSLRLAWPGVGDRSSRWSAALAASTLGALLEVFQLAVPGRSAEWSDWIADTIGAGLAVLLVRPQWLVREPRQEECP